MKKTTERDLIDDIIQLREKIQLVYNLSKCITIDPNIALELSKLTQEILESDEVSIEHRRKVIRYQLKTSIK